MFYFEPKDCNYRFDYQDIAKYLNKNLESGNELEAKKLMYMYGKTDLFFLMYFILNVLPINDPWLVKRVYEVQDNHDRTLDLWAREHFKSTIITYALTIMKIIENPETRIGLFSNTRVLAKKFLRRIKHTLETNKLLQRVYPDIFYANPERESPKWSEDQGLLVKRKGSFAEMTVEAWGVTESMPTGAHFPQRVYDDLVTWDSTRTAEQIIKTKEGFELSHNLGVTDGGETRIIGTRYDFNDLYNDLIRSGDWDVRTYPGDVEPTFWSPAVIEQKRKDMGKYTFATQISLNPLTEDEQKFLPSWIKHYTNWPETNDYILVDPAGEKKNKSSYTVMWVVGVDAFKNRYLKDMIRDKLNLHERWIKLRDFAIKYPNLRNVGYEKYSMQGDHDYIKEKQVEEKVFFNMVPLSGSMTKNDRIKGLIPGFEQGKTFLPRELWYKDVEGKNRDLIKEFLEEEYMHFPNCSFKDMLDCLARITDPDLGVVYPTKRPVRAEEAQETWDFFNDNTELGWMAV